VIDRAIIASMGIAAAVLIAIGVYLAFFEVDSGPSGPPGSLQTDCNQMAFENRRSVSRSERWVPGVVQIGFNRGPDGPEAARLLKTTGTSYDLPLLPFRDFAVLCVRDGYEDEWVERMRAYDWVEWSHREGVDSMLAQGD
jgi:hypothetical protein